MEEGKKLKAKEAGMEEGMELEQELGKGFVSLTS